MPSDRPPLEEDCAASRPGRHGTVAGCHGGRRPWVAALGLLPPAAGAVVQEVIDVLVIGIALRAVLPGAVHTIAMPAADIATAVRLRAEHDATLPLIEQIRSVADELFSHDCDLEPVRLLLGRLEGERALRRAPAAQRPGRRR